SAGRRWRVAYTGGSLSGITAAVKAGLAITVVTPSMLGEDLENIDTGGELPELPSVEIAIHLPAGRPSDTVRELYATLQNKLGNLSVTAPSG
ncbi:MAG: LysR substrate-binding domain-containing protein, partial [bacterium]